MHSAESSSTSHTIIEITQDLVNLLVSINITNITKLIPSNYITWSLQIRSLLEGYDPFGFLDGSNLSPAPTIIASDKSSPNPAYITWKRQDRLLFSALLGAVSLPIQPLLTRGTTSHEAWVTLANTYGKQSRGHINKLRISSKNLQGFQNNLRIYAIY